MAIWILIFMYAAFGSDGARILGIFPTPSISHQVQYQIIMKALAAGGHQITVISPDPLKKPVPNYTDVDISFSYEAFRSTFNFATMDQTTPFSFISQFIMALNKMTDDQLSSPPLQKFIKSSSNKSYDLVFLEELMYQGYYGLIHHLGSPPVIGILSLGVTWTGADIVGVTSNPSYVPEILLHFSDHMTFYERFQNTLVWLWARYKIHRELLPLQESIMRKHFGAAPPPVHEAQKNMSLFMYGSNWVFGYPAPLGPAIVPFHSLHVKTKPDPLPKDLQKFLDEATDGVIYFSLGSNVFSNKMPVEKQRIFVETFSELPHKVLWKWESETLSGKPQNVRIGKWLPQQDILAHPNVKLFITQCGLQSFQEAVYHGVPLLGIPFFADQRYNARKIEEAGIGLQLSFIDITKESLLSTINEILHNASFRDSAKKMSTISRDESKDSLQNAIWWTEYVLRHKGAKHLRMAALDLEWYQYLLLDVMAFVLIVIFIVCFIVFQLTKTVFNYFKVTYKYKSKNE